MICLRTYFYKERWINHNSLFSLVTSRLFEYIYIFVALNIKENTMNDLQNIVSHFSIDGTLSDIKPLGTGLINDSYQVTTIEKDKPDYVLQRINHTIFQNVDMLQENIETVTSHIRNKLEERKEEDIDRKVLKFIPAKNGKHITLIQAIIGVL